MSDVKEISQDLLELISDSEVQTKQTQEEIEHKQHTKTIAKLDTMLSQMRATNSVIKRVHDRIVRNAD